MKHRLLPLLLALFCTSLLWARVDHYDFKSGDWYYVIADAEAKSAEIVRVGPWVPLNPTMYEEVVIPETVEHAGTTYRVTGIQHAGFQRCTMKSLRLPNTMTHIGTCAFAFCARLEEVTLPSSVTEISSGAFKECAVLRSVTLSENLTTISDNIFANCPRLERITIPEGVTHIDSWALNNCTALQEVLLPSTLTSIGGGVFFGCSSLQSISLPAGLTQLGASVFSGSGLTSIVIPEGVSRINQLSFAKCSGLREVVLPAGLTHIDSQAFEGCRNLTEVVIPTGVEEIDRAAFSGCSALTRVVLPDKITYIAEKVFADCSHLQEITLPAGVTWIGDEAFRNCSALRSVTLLSPTIPSIGDGAFQSIPADAVLYVWSSLLEEYKASEWAQSFSDIRPISESFSDGMLHYRITDLAAQTVELIGDASYAQQTEIVVPATVTYQGISYAVTTLHESVFKEYTALTRVVLPEGVTRIGDVAFYGCTGLTEVVLPSTLTSIGQLAFYHCSSLTKVVLPEGLTSLSDYVFEGCTALKEVNIPDGITRLEDNLFAGCTALTEIILHANITAIGDEAFRGCTSLQTVSSLATNPPSLGANTFANVPYDILLKVYGRCLDSYITSDWAYTFLDITYISEEFSDGTFRYLINDPTTFTVKLLPDASYSLLTEVCIPSTVTYIKPTYTVAQINESAFKENTSLTRVVLSDGMKTIDNAAFYGCTGLEQLVLPSTLTNIGQAAFCRCTKLEQLVLPDGLTTIGEYAFEGCSGLTDVTLPKNLTRLTANVFDGCTSIAHLTLPENITAIDEEAFLGCSALQTVTSLAPTPPSLGNDAFRNIPADAVLYVYEHALSAYRASDWAKYFQRIEIQPLPETFYDGTLYYRIIDPTARTMAVIRDDSYAQLTDISVPAMVRFVGLNYTVTTIDESAFKEYEGLRRVVLSEGLTSVSNIAFYGCSALEQVVLPSTLTSIGQAAFCRCAKLEQVVLPDGLTAIGEFAFEGCSELEEVTLPKNLTRLTANVFDGCTSIAHLTLPDNLTTIDEEAFLGCSALIDITLPAGIRRIDDRAFSGCAALTTVTSLATTPPTITTESFNNIPAEAVLYVYDRCMSDYCTYVWLPFFDRILPIDESVTFSDGTLYYRITDPETFTVEVIYDDSYLLFAELNVPPTADYLGQAYAVTAISETAFMECEELTSITLPEGLTTIEQVAFYYCTALQSITLPAGVTDIRTAAFAACESLQTVTSLATTPPALGEETFVGIPQDALLYVPANSVGTYKASDWKPFFADVLAIGDVPSDLGEAYNGESGSHDDTPRKIIHDGHVRILRGGQMYDLTGQRTE